MINMPVDDSPTMVRFGSKYTVKLASRSEWDNPDSLLNDFTHVFYTDGSLTSDGCGSGWTMNNMIARSYSIGKSATVFQTEVFAIIQVANWIIEERMKENRIAICSDSQAALQALLSPECRSKLVQECKDRLRSITRWNKVNLIWVPGHCGIEGNEIADELARTGSSECPIGPEPFIGVSSTCIYSWIEKYAALQHAERWKELNTCKHSKFFVKEPSRKLAEFVLKLDRTECRGIVGIITGHSNNGRHLARMGLINDANLVWRKRTHRNIGSVSV